jgi:hypothetical protein
MDVLPIGVNTTPLLTQIGRTDNTIPWPRMIGLTGLAMEAADDHEWAKRISRDEAIIAARYSVCELNGFPTWLRQLRAELPDVVDEVIKGELRWELHEGAADKTFTHNLSALRYGDVDFRNHFQSFLFELLSDKDPVNEVVLDHTLSLMLEGHIDAIVGKQLADLAYIRFNQASVQSRKYTWLIALLSIDGFRGSEMLKEWIAGLPSPAERKETMVNFCAALTHHGEPRFGLAVRDYERIDVLSELLPFIYQFVRFEDDAYHQGSYSPDNRDRAERTRSHLLGVIANTPGRPSYDALMNLSKSVSYGFSKDRMDYLAKERAALDAEFEPLSGAAVAEFAVSAERQPRTEAELYELVLARLDELKIDIEDGDESEAALLQKLTKETEVRTVIANRFRKSSRSLYTVGSEEEFADATRSDIRLNAPQVSAPVPIELKIADKWTLAELSERLENQLIGQYMRVSQCGVFLVVHNGTKKYWEHPLTKERLNFAKLIETLNRNAVELTGKYPHLTALEVFGIDFTARAVGRRKRNQGATGVVAT